MATSLLAALGMFALNVLTPGTSFVFTISHAMRHGRRSGLFVAFGLTTVDTLFAVVATAGLATLVGQHTLIVKSVSLLGGIWFLYSGARLVCRRTRGLTMQQPADATRGVCAFAAYRRGVMAGAFNLRVILFFASMFVATFANRPSAAVGMVLVAGVACVSALARSAIVMVFTFRTMLRLYVERRRAVDALSGSALALFGLQLAVPASEALAAQWFAC